MKRVVFRTDADLRNGLGHLARCLAIGRDIRSVHGSTEIVLQGGFDRRARSFIDAEAPWATIVQPNEPIRADIGVIDRLSDPDDPESWDHALARDMQTRCGRLIAVLSGQTDTAVNASFLRIGYQPGGPGDLPPYRRWGLEYAPGLGAADARPPARNAVNALIAFGGSLDDIALPLTLDALALVSEVETAEILLSPINSGRQGPTRTSAGQILKWWPGCNDVRTLIERADVVVASFGNLAYEALSLSRPVCYLGQKAFQCSLAATMEAEGFAVSAGDARSAAPSDVAASLRRTIAEPERARRAVSLIDGRGPERIARLVLETAGLNG